MTVKGSNKMVPLLRLTHHYFKFQLNGKWYWRQYHWKPQKVRVDSPIEQFYDGERGTKGILGCYIHASGWGHFQRQGFGGKYVLRGFSLWLFHQCSKYPEQCFSSVILGSIHPHHCNSQRMICCHFWQASLLLFSEFPRAKTLGSPVPTSEIQYLFFCFFQAWLGGSILVCPQYKFWSPV